MSHSVSGPHSPAFRGEPDDGAAATARAPQNAEEAFREYAGRVYCLARRMLRSEADVEDVVQDVFLLVVRKLGTFRGESSFPTWIHRVTTNAALLHWRKRALVKEKGGNASLEYAVAEGAGASPRRRADAPPDRQVIGREDRQLIDQAMARLPKLYREAYLLHEVEGLQNVEIGERLCLSLPAVKSRLHRARMLLRKFLAPHFEVAEDESTS